MAIPESYNHCLLNKGSSHLQGITVVGVRSSHKFCNLVGSHDKQTADIFYIYMTWELYVYIYMYIYMYNTLTFKLDFRTAY